MNINESIYKYRIFLNISIYQYSITKTQLHHWRVIHLSSHPPLSHLARICPPGQVWKAHTFTIECVSSLVRFVYCTVVHCNAHDFEIRPIDKFSSLPRLCIMWFVCVFVMVHEDLREREEERDRDREYDVFACWSPQALPSLTSKVWRDLHPLDFISKSVVHIRCGSFVCNGWWLGRWLWTPGWRGPPWCREF